MKVTINENALRGAIRRHLVAEAVQNEDVFDVVRSKPGQQRELITREQFIDLMSKVKGNRFITFGYIDGVSVRDEYKVKRRNPATNYMKTYPDWDRIGQGLGILDKVAGIVKCTVRKINWTNTGRFGLKYGEYVKELNKLKQEWNDTYNWTLQPRESRPKPQYKGNKYTNKNLETSTDTDNNSFYGILNVANTRNDRIGYYLIDDNGNIIGSEYTYEQLKKFLVGTLVDCEGEIRSQTSDEAIIQKCLSAIQELKFNTRRFKDDAIMFMSGTIDGEDESKKKYLYVNDQLKSVVDDIKINPAVFYDRIMQRYSKAAPVLDNGHGGLRDIGRAKAQQEFDKIYRSIKPAQAPGEASAEAIQEAIRQVLKEMNLL